MGHKRVDLNGDEGIDISPRIRDLRVRYRGYFLTQCVFQARAVPLVKLRSPSVLPDFGKESRNGDGSIDYQSGMCDL